MWRKALVAVPVSITIWDLVVSIQPVSGRSMQPTLNPATDGNDSVRKIRDTAYGLNLCALHLTDKITI